MPAGNQPRRVNRFVGAWLLIRPGQRIAGHLHRMAKAAILNLAWREFVSMGGLRGLLRTLARAERLRSAVYGLELGAAGSARKCESLYLGALVLRLLLAGFRAVFGRRCRLGRRELLLADSASAHSVAPIIPAPCRK